MLINVIEGGDDAFNAVIFGEQHPANRQYFENEIAHIGSISHSLSSIGQQFYSNSQQLFDRYNDADAMRIARAAVRAVKGLYQANVIMPLLEIGHFQQAQPIMQRWVMANPVIRQAYHDNRLDGYSESYVDLYPGMTSDNHYDYRRVMDGVIDETDTCYARFYIDDLVDGDKELTHLEKADILQTWQVAELFYKTGKEDPTSQFNSPL